MSRSTIAVLAALIVAMAVPLAPAMAEKKLTPQQQKMKECGASWQDHKKSANVKGRTAYRKFMSECLKKA